MGIGNGKKQRLMGGASETSRECTSRSAGDLQLIHISQRWGSNTALQSAMGTGMVMGTEVSLS